MHIGLIESNTIYQFAGIVVTCFYKNRSMNIRLFKYASPITVYFLAFLSFTGKGWITWSPVIYAWLLIPFTELIIKPDEYNLNQAEEELARKDRWYDWLLYGFVALQYITLAGFILVMKNDHGNISGWDLAGRVGTMGLLCGTFGINIGHELGHRSNRFEQFLAKASLLTSLYMHFFIEHNKGHHKNVATHEDPSSARYNEPVYTFYFRTILFSWLSAWKIAGNDLKKKNLPALHWKNEMLQAQLIQLVFVMLIWLLAGGFVTGCFLVAAFIGILLLETVNYIEHYGLQRKTGTDGMYERTMPWHSWNSNHVLGRIMLFELSRHSDHHYLASRKYQVLKHHAGAPQLPTGYPGSMILAMIPPLWFMVMNRKIRLLEKSAGSA